MQKITPFLWFDNSAEEAVNFYVSIFSSKPGPTSSRKDSKVKDITRYDEAGSKASGQPKGTAMTVPFQLDGQDFVALNGGPHFKFTEAISFVVNCKTQEEVDYFWEKLSEGGDPKAQMCGWLKDKFGVSWQVLPTILGKLMSNPAKSQSVMQAVLQMKKINIEALQKAYDNN